MFEYQKSHRFFAQVADGLDELARRELEGLGATEVKPAYRGAWFTADLPSLYRINYRTRLVTRIFAPLITFDCHSARYLYKTLRRLQWDVIVGKGRTFAVTANLSDSAIRHSQYACRVVKDAVVDHFRETTGSRPDVDPKRPDLWLHLHLHRNRATVHLDTSGGSLHRRGYRKHSVEAPMMETLAAAILELSEWDGGVPLADPMCGSGTFLAEALMKLCRIPAGYLRPRFGLENLPDHDADLWKQVRSQADAGIRALPEGALWGGDISAGNLEVARGNCALLPHGDRITWWRGDFRRLEPGLPGRVIVTNPPYGRRLRGGEDPRRLIRDLGDFLKRRCTGSIAYVYVGDRALLKSVGLRPKWKRPLHNGPLDGRLARYDLY